MRRLILVNIFLFAILALGFVYLTYAADTHVALSSTDIKWMDAPQVAPGVQMATLEGDPAGTGSYTFRMKIPDGFKIPPHWHPKAENVVVIEGIFQLGMGEKFDESALKDFGPGSFAMLPAEMRHFGFTKGETVLQIYGTGPFKIIYVNPADDPAKKTMSH
jgi:anti-sigma factor ChrR (cupin superfamily)